MLQECIYISGILLNLLIWQDVSSSPNHQIKIITKISTYMVERLLEMNGIDLSTCRLYFQQVQLNDDKPKLKFLGGFKWICQLGQRKINIFCISTSVLIVTNILYQNLSAYFSH